MWGRGRWTPGPSTPGPSTAPPSPEKSWWGNTQRPSDTLEPPVDVPVGPGRSIAGFKSDENLDAHIRNQPFYLGYPVMDVSKSRPGIDKYARDKYGGIWSYDPDHPWTARFIDHTKSVLPPTEHISSVLRRIDQANTAETEGGLLARALKAGWPFSAPRSSPPEWAHVWNGAKTYQVPAHDEAGKWDNIRTALQSERAVKLQDGYRLWAFRLEGNGNVAMQVFDHLHKRSIVSSDKAGSGDTFKDELTKRADPPGMFNGRPDRDVDYVKEMNRLPYEAPRTPYTEEEKEGQYSRLIHYRGYPVLNVNKVPKSTLMHALQDHDQVWMASEFPADHQGFVPPFRIDRSTGLFSDGSQQAVEQLNGASALRDTYGESIMLLKYGRPFPKRTGLYFKPGWKGVAKTHEFGLDQHRIEMLRYQLNSANRLRVRISGT